MENLLVWKLVGDYCDGETLFNLMTVCSELHQLFNDEYWRVRVFDEFGQTDCTEDSWKQQYWYEQQHHFYFELANAFSTYSPTLFPNVLQEENLSLKRVIRICKEFQNRIHQTVNTFFSYPETVSLREQSSIQEPRTKEFLISCSDNNSTIFRLTNLTSTELVLYTAITTVSHLPIDSQISMISPLFLIFGRI